jgi:glucosylceramidase
MNRKLLLAGLFWILNIQGGCSRNGGGGEPEPPPPPPPPPPPAVNEVDFWLTKGDQTALLQKQNTVLSFGSTANSNPTITVDSTQRFQSIDGFGYTLTGGSAELINGLSTNIRQNLLLELFSDVNNGISVSYLRISIGASDLSSSVYTYNDMPAGQTDPNLTNFSIASEQSGGTGLVPLLKDILAINPQIKILATPWTAPVWMKDNGNSVGGKLKPEYYGAYAQYFVKYIQAMKAEGINIDAITPQNEPLHGGNNPSMEMLATEQRDFIRDHLGPAFQAANISTKIIVYDHNCDRPDYPLTILNDPAAKAFVDGSAFHLYAGDIGALSTVRDQHPDKNIYFTEQYTASNGDFSGDLKWHLRNVIIGSLRNWSRNALEWNLANDAAFGPHTPGGCTVCKGALTIIGSSTYQRNVAYYIIGHASRFVPPGSVRINSNTVGNLRSVAFERPDKKKVLIVLNDGDSAQSFNLRFKEKWVSPTLPPNSVATFVW